MDVKHRVKDGRLQVGFYHRCVSFLELYWVVCLELFSLGEASYPYAKVVNLGGSLQGKQHKYLW